MHFKDIPTVWAIVNSSWAVNIPLLLGLALVVSTLVFTLFRPVDKGSRSWILYNKWLAFGIIASIASFISPLAVDQAGNSAIQSNIQQKYKVDSAIPISIDEWGEIEEVQVVIDGKQYSYIFRMNDETNEPFLTNFSTIASPDTSEILR